MLTNGQISTAYCTNMHCSVTEHLDGKTDANPLAHFNATIHNNELQVELPPSIKIAADAGEAFQTSVKELSARYVEVFAKPGKPVARPIKHKIELLDPTKPIQIHYQ